MKVVINGVASLDDMPESFQKIVDQASFVFAPEEEDLRREISDAEGLLGWNFRGRDLENCWAEAKSLKWIHWCGAGVDALLFEDLASSDVTLTNARGLFDTAMAEYVLGYMLSEAKLFRQTWAFQQAASWNYRWSQKLEGTRAVVVGVGSIGTEIGRLLKANGVVVSGVGRRARPSDAVFSHIDAQDDLHKAVADADWVVAVLPSTAQTKGVFDGPFFSAMKKSARFINVGRGTAVVDQALIEALRNETIAGAMLDVFQTEPLPAEDPLWKAPNIVISPHMSGDFHGYIDDVVALFAENLRRYQAGEPLMNVVDKASGFVPRQEA